MTSVVAIGADDFSAIGPVPSVGTKFTFGVVTLQIDATGSRIITGNRWSVVLDASGNASTQVPDSQPGEGLRIWSRLRGWNEVVTVAGYPTGTIDLVELITAYRVDPATLEDDQTAPPAWIASLKAYVRTVNGIAPDASGAVVLGSTEGVQYNSEVPVSSAVIPHNFGRLPNVQLYDGGVRVETDWSADAHNAYVTWPSPTVFTAVLT